MTHRTKEVRLIFLDCRLISLVKAKNATKRKLSQTSSSDIASIFLLKKIKEHKIAFNFVCVLFEACLMV